MKYSDFRCNKCSAVFEEEFHDKIPSVCVCPFCGGTATRKWGNNFIIPFEMRAGIESPWDYGKKAKKKYF